MLNSRAGFINDAIANSRTVRGRTVIESDFGRSGHALYGPYQPLGAGSYFVQFHLVALDLGQAGDDERIAVIDTSVDGGKENVASHTITAGLLRSGQANFLLEFSLARAAVVEYRVWVSGAARLEIDAYCAVGRKGTAPISTQFPAIAADTPAVLKEHEERLRYLYERGFAVMIEGADVVLARDGIRFYARQWDDLHLVEEVFLEQVYNFDNGDPTVVIDIGMNLGLVSMQFANNPFVQKVYSFEPFPSTYSRAMANLSLNPDLAAKIAASNSGVGDIEGKQTFRVNDTEDSGSRSTRDIEGEGGIAIELDMRLASNVFKQVLDENPGCNLVAKIDCEGAEYGIFEQLANAGVWDKVTAVMVEWHHAIPGKGGADLIAPLKKAGFMIFDRSPHTLVRNCNGFFYGIRKSLIATA